MKGKATFIAQVYIQRLHQQKADPIKSGSDLRLDIGFDDQGRFVIEYEKYKFINMKDIEGEVVDMYLEVFDVVEDGTMHLKPEEFYLIESLTIDKVEDEVIKFSHQHHKEWTSQALKIEVHPEDFHLFVNPTRTLTKGDVIVEEMVLNKVYYEYGYGQCFMFKLTELPHRDKFGSWRIPIITVHEDGSQGNTSEMLIHHFFGSQFANVYTYPAYHGLPR